MPRISTLDLIKKKLAREPITMLTAYDYSMARIVDKAGIDCILVGDSLGMVMLGYDDTIPVTIEDMIHHGKAVVRGSTRAHVVVDMPFMSYQVSKEQAIFNAGRIMQQTGCQSVKLEGGQEIAETVKGIVAAGIPVMGHIGLTPQSVNQLGGFRVQGKDKASAIKLIQDAKALQDAGAYAIVLESVPQELAELITQSVAIPTIGIGAGPHCDGQVLVIHDMLGIFDRFLPKFVKRYAEISAIAENAIATYINEVKTKTFPGREHSFTMSPELLNEIIETLKSPTSELAGSAIKPEPACAAVRSELVRPAAEPDAACSTTKELSRRTAEPDATWATAKSERANPR